MLETVLRIGVLVCTGYIVLVYGMYVFLMLLGHVESRRRRRERALDDVDALVGSRFAPGVSVIVPACDEGGGIADAVGSLLAIDYPVFEVIVVNDGSTDDTVERLVDAFRLVPVAASSRDIVETSEVNGFYRSPTDPRILVVDKENGGKADSLNAGLNHCRYRYVCAVDADMVFVRGALTRAMREIVRDPAVVVGLTSYFENARNPSRSLPDGVTLHRAGDETAVRLSDVRLPPRVLQQPDRVGAPQLHALRGGCVPDLASRPRRGAQRLVAASSRARTSSSRFASIEPSESEVARTGSPACPTASA